MMRAAPATRAPCTIESPMPPRPSTSTDAPGSTRAVFRTAPTPVCTAHPITHATSSGTPRGIFTAPVAGVTTCSANPPTPTPRKTIWSPRLSPVDPSRNVFVAIIDAFRHTPGSPRTHQ